MWNFPSLTFLNIEIFIKWNKDFDDRTQTTLWQKNLELKSQLWIYNKFSRVPKIISSWKAASSTENM
jgi:hypothetical protein